MKNNHQTIVVEYSNKFDKDMISDTIMSLCRKLSDKDDLHIIVNGCNDIGSLQIDKVTNNKDTWNRFNKIEGK